MNKRRVIAAAVVLAVLCTGNYTYSAYGYWMDQVKSGVNLSVSYPVSVRVRLKKEETEASKENTDQIEETGGSETGQTGKTEENG